MDLSTRVESFGSDNQSWLASAHGTDHGRGGTCDAALFTKNTHAPDGTLRSGTPLGKVTATGLFGPYDGAANDGRETLVGFVLSPVKFPASGAGKFGVSILEHGRVVEANLPIAIDAAGKTDVAGRVTFA